MYRYYCSSLNVVSTHKTKKNIELFLTFMSLIFELSYRKSEKYCQTTTRHTSIPTEIVIKV